MTQFSIATPGWTDKSCQAACTSHEYCRAYAFVTTTGRCTLYLLGDDDHPSKYAIEGGDNWKLTPCDTEWRPPDGTEWTSGGACDLDDKTYATYLSSGTPGVTCMQKSDKTSFTAVPSRSQWFVGRPGWSCDETCEHNGQTCTTDADNKYVDSEYDPSMGNKSNGPYSKYRDIYEHGDELSRLFLSAGVSCRPGTGLFFPKYAGYPRDDTCALVSPTKKGEYNYPYYTQDNGVSSCYAPGNSANVYCRDKGKVADRIQRLCHCTPAEGANTARPDRPLLGEWSCNVGEGCTKREFWEFKESPAGQFKCPNGYTSPDHVKCGIATPLFKGRSFIERGIYDNKLPKGCITYADKTGKHIAYNRGILKDAVKGSRTVCMKSTPTPPKDPKANSIIICETSNGKCTTSCEGTSGSDTILIQGKKRLRRRRRRS